MSLVAEVDSLGAYIPLEEYYLAITVHVRIDGKEWSNPHVKLEILDREKTKLVDSIDFIASDEPSGYRFKGNGKYFTAKKVDNRGTALKLFSDEISIDKGYTLTLPTLWVIVGLDTFDLSGKELPVSTNKYLQKWGYYPYSGLEWGLANAEREEIPYYRVNMDYRRATKFGVSSHALIINARGICDIGLSTELVETSASLELKGSLSQKLYVPSDVGLGVIISDRGNMQEMVAYFTTGIEFYKGGLPPKFFDRLNEGFRYNLTVSGRRVFKPDTLADFGGELTTSLALLLGIGEVGSIRLVGSLGSDFDNFSDLSDKAFCYLGATVFFEPIERTVIRITYDIEGSLAIIQKTKAMPSVAVIREF